MICRENHHAKNNQNIHQKLNLSQQKLRGHPIIFLLSIKSSFSVVQEKITITWKLTNGIITANQIEPLPSLLR